MKTIKYFLLALIFPFISFSQEDDFNASFNIYTNGIYSSAQEVSITLSAYGLKRRAECNFTIYKIRDVEGFFSRQTSSYSIDVLSKDSMNLISLCDEADSFTKYPKVTGSENYWYTYETFTYKPKSKGAFLVKVVYKNKVAYSGYFVTDLGMISEAGANGMVSYVIDRKTGTPISDVDLGFFLGQKKIGIGKTANGLFYKSLDEADKQYAADNNISYPLVIGKYGDEIVVSDPYLYFGYGANMFTAYVHTSQPVYRPESKVEFKGTIRKINSGKFENIGVREITIKIKDSRGAEVYKEVLSTNSFGTFAGGFVPSKDSPLGQYWIYAELGQNQIYSSSFYVEEYKKPEYKVGITLDKDQYTNDESIKGVVQADYYFGSPVQEATVEYNVYKKTFYKPWWYFSEYSWWYEEYYENQDDNQKYNNSEFIYSGTGTLDKEGRFDFDYAIKEDFKAKYNNYWWYYDREKDYYESDFIYIIQAKVTDKSRREIASTKTVYVTRAEFYLVASTDKYLYKPDEKVLVNVRSNTFADKPVPATFVGTVNKLTWGKYPDYKQEKNFVTTFSGSTGITGTGTGEFEAAGEGYYEIEISSNDAKGKKVTTTTYCYVSTGDMWWWYNQSGTLQIIPDKDSYKPGEVCKALIITTQPGANVLITTQNDNIISYRVEKIESTSKMIEIPVDENATPNFYITAAYVQNGQFFSASKSVMVIPEKKFLTVNIGLDKANYKPKEEGTVLIRVTDNNGNAVSNAELSLGVVDEAVYAIKPDNTKDPRKFFYSPKFNSVTLHYSDNYYYYGYSRLLTIYERFNIKSTSETELGTIKGKLSDKNGNAIAGAVIVIDNDFVAATTDSEGNFEFKLPEGSYTIGVKKNKKTNESDQELKVSKGQTKTVNLRTDASGDLDFTSTFSEQNESGLLADEITLTNGKKTDAPKSVEKSLNGKLKKESSKDGDFEESDDKRDFVDAFVDAEVRSDFRDAIYWQPSVVTDENGFATIKVKFPDNLTTWRFTTRVVTEDTKVGQDVQTVITRKDLLVRMETPRFFQQNDEVTISTIIHNYLDEAKETKINLKVENLQLTEGSEQTITIGKNEEKRIDWKVKVTEPIGFAKLTASALTNKESDAVELKVPLQPHGLQLAKYQSMDVADVNKTEIKYVEVPQYTDMRSTKLTLNVSPSLASTMLTALDELIGYPYGCVEQTMSRFLPTVIVANAFKDLNAPISAATQKDLPKMVEAGYNRLYSMQHYDGGWGWWTNDQSHPFMTSYVVYGLALGNKSGHKVKQDVLKKGISSIKAQLVNELDATTRAYMLYSMSVAEDKDTKIYEEQFEKIISSKDMNDYTLALLTMTARNIGDETNAKKFGDMLLKNAQDFGEGGAYWGGKAWHYNWQDDKIQTTAMAVKALVADPQTLKDNPELMNKAIRWLMMQRQGGGWWNTQSTAFIIYAMVDYLKTSKELEPDYDVKIFVNNELLLEKHMTKEDIFKKDWKFEIDNKKLKEGQNEIRIEKNGAGKVYVASDLRYYTTEGKIQPRENGFRVTKEFYKLEKYTSYSDGKITYKKRYFDGNVKSGDEIFVKVIVEAKEDNMQYFMLEDPIPAGCEVVKDDWAFKVDDEKDFSGWEYYWWRWWYADKDIRDNRVSFFATYLYGRTYEFTYILHAQIPGKYNVLPATGMLMYYPDVRGSSGELELEISD